MFGEFSLEEKKKILKNGVNKGDKLRIMTEDEKFYKGWFLQLDEKEEKVILQSETPTFGCSATILKFKIDDLAEITFLAYAAKTVMEK